MFVFFSAMWLALKYGWDLNSCVLEEGMEDDGVILALLNSFAE